MAVGVAPTMELALNLVWLAISVASLATLARWRIRQRAWTESDRRRFAVPAVFCLLGLLFPIISITDDLSNDVLLVEASVKRRSAHDAGHHDRITTAVALGVIPAPRPIIGLALGAIAAFDLALCAGTFDLVSLSARAPPRLVR